MPRRVIAAVKELARRRREGARAQALTAPNPRPRSSAIIRRPAHSCGIVRRSVWLAGYDHFGRRLPVHGVEFVPERTASGAILTLPFTAAHARQMTSAARELALEGFVSVALDLPGHGRSGGVRGHFDIEQLLRTIAGIADHYARHLSLPVTVMGSSWGGDLALLTALWEQAAYERTGRPRRIDALVAQAIITPWLRETVIRFHPGLALLFDRTGIGRRLVMAGLGKSVPIGRMFQMSDIYAQSHRRRRFLTDPLTLKSYHTRSYLDYLTHCPEADPAALGVPVLLIQGVKDRLVSLEYETLVHNTLAARGVNAELAVIDDGSHALFEEQTEQATRTVACWLRRVLPKEAPRVSTSEELALAAR